MANRNTDESIRKPRRTKGTPFYIQRNLISVGVLAAGGLCWYLYELWPQSRKLKASILEGKFSTPAPLRQKFLEAELAAKEPGYLHLVGRLKARAEAREDELYVDESKPKPWYVNFFSGGPDLRTEKISKYFAKVTHGDDDAENSSDPADSPYKDCQNRVKRANSDDSFSDLDDFRTPKAINKVSKILSKPVSKIPSKSAPKKRRTRQPQLRKYVEDNLQYSDVQPEHLQMALALSESTYEAENPNEIRTSQEKKEGFKAAFERFGFGYSKNKHPVRNKREYDIKKNHKRSRWRYVTPVLKTRTNEDRQALISSKVSLILTQNSRKSSHNHTHDTLEIYCESLEGLVDSKMFQINCFGLDRLNEPDLFYVSGLGLETSPASCGRLLRDWRRIPGREATPERDASNTSVTRDLTPPTSSFSPACTNEKNIQSITIKDFNTLTPPIINESSNKIVVCDDLATPTLSENLDPSATFEQVVNIEDPVNESESTIIVISDNLTPPTVNDSSNASTFIGVCHDLAPHTSNDAETLTNESETVIKRSDLSPPSDEPTPPTFSDREIARRISQNSEESSDCYIVDSSEMNISPTCWEITKSTRREIEDTRRLANDAVKSSKYRLSPLLEMSCSEPIAPSDLNITPPCRVSFDSGSSPSQSSPNRKIRHDCVSPDLFGSEDEEIVSPERLRGGQSLLPEEIQCCDLTQSDDEEKSFHLRLSDAGDSIGRRSELNVTEYVEDLLSNYKEEGKLEKVSTSADDSQESQTSIYISDEELNYSSVFGTPQPKKKVEYNFSEDEDFGLSLTQRIHGKGAQTIQENENVSPESCNKSEISLHFDDDVGTVGYEPSQKPPSGDASPSNISSNEPPDDLPDNNLSFITPNEPPDDLPDNNLSFITPNKASPPVATLSLDGSFNAALEQMPVATPPTTSSFVIKTKNVTPMANYDGMDTPNIAKELDRFGLKPLKRKKGAKLLKYIYESTHPVVGDENRPPAKKRRTREFESGGIVGEVGEEEVVLERKQLKSVASCLVPLHIVWYNFVMSNPKIRENILLYEPLQLEVLHSMLKDQGFRFNIQDLLAFLDKKCITIRTAQGPRRKPK